MNQEEAIEKLYIEWQEWKNQEYPDNKSIDDYFSEQEKKYIFLSDGIVGITTYDDELDTEFGKMILDTMIQIKNRTTFEYIKNEENYRKYILSCNFIKKWLDWGASIRDAWFNNIDGKIIPNDSFYNIGYENEFLNIADDFMDWFIKWLQRP